MKAVLLSAVLLAMGIGTFDQRTPSGLPQTVTGVYDRDVSAKESMLLSVAEAMPEDKYDFAPVNGEFQACGHSAR